MNIFLIKLLILSFRKRNKILLLFPIALTLYQVSMFGFSVALIFFIVLTIGFVLEIGTGAIKI